MVGIGQKISFLSHMQRGLAQYRDGTGRVTARLTLSADDRDDDVVQTLELGGPEHVTKLSPDQVIRMVPSPDSADFEPNFFPAVEFRLPDLPWMFSPSGSASDTQLAPWLVLVVVERGGGVYLTEPAGDNLAILRLDPPCDIARELPDLTESWAWAHVQCDAEIDNDELARDLFASRPELFRSRLVCPRRLKPLTDYIACVVPATKGGVAAGRGASPGDDAHDPAWEGTEPSLHLPVYHAWSFRTAQRGDFEDLVRRLAPIELEAGVVPLDLSQPGDPRLPDGDGPQVMFRGALVGTEAPRKPWDRKHAAEWRAGMGKVLETHRPGRSPNRPNYDALKDDPVVAPPLWGGRKIDVTTAPEEPEEGDESDWFATLNYHPSHRAAAGLGAECVRRNQEELMAEAWRQVDELRAVNRVLNQTLLAGETTGALKRKKIDPLDAGDAMSLAGTAKARMGTRFEALRTATGANVAPDGALTPAMARLGRRKGPVGRHTALTEPTAAATVTWFASAPDAALSYADFVTPAELSNTDFIARLMPVGLEDDDVEEVDDYLRRDVVLRPLGGAAGSAIASPEVMLRPTSQSVFRPQISHLVPGQRRQSRGGGKKRTAAGGKGQVSAMAITARATAGESAPLSDAFDPLPVLKARLGARLNVPGGVLDTPGLPRPFLVTPEFDMSGYTMLRAISADAVIPGIKAVPINSVGLATVNAKFVESWLVGANAEMAREFLWREYPGRLDGTYFRRFWDMLGGGDDIDPIRHWKGRLGDNQIGKAVDGTLVLLIKGEVLARFPELRIYASRAMWDDRRFRREAREKGRPYETRMPLFGGWLDRSTAFFAFDLDLDEAKGTLELMGPAPGWFFVFEQPPEGVQFGLDVPGSAGDKPEFWADLDWSHGLDAPWGTGERTHLSIARGVGVEELAYDRDMFFETWGRSASAQARISLQRPARVLMHASGMLS